MPPPFLTPESLGYLVEVVTEDGLRLKGFLQTKDIVSASSRRLWILVHGVSGNFYDSSLLRLLAVNLLQAGEDVLSINTRGHDPLAYISTNGGMTRVGSSFEMIEDAKLDLAAWIEWSRKNGYERIGLLGHSLGAVKVALFASERVPDDIDAVVCLSPPRLSAEVLAADENYGEVYQEQRREAEDLLRMNKPEALISIRFPQPMYISAATFLDKYGSDEYDYFAMAKKIGSPTLWVFGEQEVRGKRSNFRGCDEQLSKVVDGSNRHQVMVVPRADHNYSQNRDGLWATFKNWMDDPPPLI